MGQTITRYFKKEEIDDNVIFKIANELKKGKLVVFPTDTVYGIGTNAYDKDACTRIYEVKKRPKVKPLSVLISDFSMLTQMVASISPTEKKLMEAFWPGPLTILFKKKEGVLPNVVSTNEFIAIRLISECLIYKLIQASGVPIVAPSANLSGSPTGIKIENITKELDGKVDYILDCGDIQNDMVSTIIQVQEEKAYIIREGKIRKEEVAKIVPVKMK
ncbi:MAG: threonylcarbamoyl-AMP synthase [Clostridia bacterium]|nr:threonylcarbamoyl-AMP synthase [Clostridia bacterium]